MARAAYCSACGRNVWVGPDGGCANGHDRSCLSDHYETSETPVSAPAVIPAPSVSPALEVVPIVTFESTNNGVRRVGAFLIDYVLAVIVNMVCGLVVGLVIGITLGAVLPADELRTLASVVGFVVGILVITSYFALPEYLWGTTPGKALLSLRVVRLDGSRISFGQAYGRNFALFIDLLFLGIVGLLTMNRGPYHQRVGDQLAKTAVVRKAA